MPSSIYPGSFDPITNGHTDIIERALNIFDHIYLAVVENPSQKTLFSITERVDMIRELYKKNERVTVESFTGLLSEYVLRKDTSAVIRGLRVVTDFDYELSLAHMNRKLNSEMETVFFMASDKLSFVSSSLIKEVARYGGNISDYVPSLIEKNLMLKFKALNNL